MLGFKNKYKAPSGFKYGKNIEIKKNGKIIGIKQYACDFYGNKVLVKKIENEIVNKELVPLMEDFFVQEIIDFTSDEFSNRIKDADWNVVNVSWEELNQKYNEEKYFPIDGRLVRIADHLSALMEADISIKHGITSVHLQNGRDGLLYSYKEDEIINGINVYNLFHDIVS